MPPEPSLRRGAVFYMLLRNVQSPQPHYLVVLNANAGTDKIIVLSVITSRVEESKRRATVRKYPACPSRANIGGCAP